MNKYIHIFEESPCPSLEVLDRYLQQSLKPSEQLKVEQHLVDCPLCADALEGLSMVEDKRMAKMRIKRIGELTQRKLWLKEPPPTRLSKRQSRVKPLQLSRVIIPAAAAVAFLCLTVYIIYELNRPPQSEVMVQAPPTLVIPPDSALDELAEVAVSPALTDSVESVEEAAPAPSPAPIAESRSRPTSPAAARPARRQPLAEARPAETPPTAMAPPAQTLQEPAAGSAASVPPVAVETEVTEIEARKPEERFEISLEADEKDAAPTASRKKKQAEQPETSKTEDQAAEVPFSGSDAPLKPEYDRQYGAESKFQVLSQLMAEGKSLYARQNYPLAAEKFEEILQGDENQQEARYLYASSLYESRRFEEALKAYKLLRSHPTYGEEATWKMALCYEQLHKPKKARKLFRQIAKAGGQYAARARQKLD